jgi:VanZ family protein
VSPPTAHSEPPPRRAPLPATAAWATLLVGLLLFMVLGRAPDRTLFWETAYHFGHVLIFGGVAVSLLGLLRARGASPADAGPWWVAFWMAVVLGALTELLQRWQPGRDASVWHFLRDVAGAASFLLVVAMVGWPWGGVRLIRSGRGRLAAVVAAVAMIGGAGADLLATVIVYGERDMALPTLYAFDGSRRERMFIETHDSALTPGAGPRGLAATDGPLARLDLNPAIYPGITLREPYPDWRWARSLELTLVSDLDAPLMLTIRIHDAAHDNRYEDRFNRQLVVRPGVNRILIPLDDVRRAPARREMDMRHIRQIILFGYQVTAPTHVYLGPIRLRN